MWKALRSTSLASRQSDRAVRMPPTARMVLLHIFPVRSDLPDAPDEGDEVAFSMLGHDRLERAAYMGRVRPRRGKSLAAGRQLTNDYGKPNGCSDTMVPPPEILAGIITEMSTLATTAMSAQTAMKTLSDDPLFGSSRSICPAISKVRRKASRRSFVIRSTGSGRSRPSNFRPELTSIP